MLAGPDIAAGRLYASRPCAMLVASFVERHMDLDRSREAFSRSVEAEIDALYGVALRLTRNPVDAEDLVAEAVARAWSAIASLEEWDQFRAWIFRIMRNHFISGYRRRKHAPQVVGLDPSIDDQGGGDLASLLHAQSDEFLQWWADPEKEVADRLLGEQILSAIDALPEVFRVTILLVNVDGLTYDEAAEALGVAPGTVRSRMKRGRTLLQKALWEHGRDAGLLPDREVSR